MKLKLIATALLPFISLVFATDYNIATEQNDETSFPSESRMPGIFDLITTKINNPVSKLMLIRKVEKKDDYSCRGLRGVPVEEHCLEYVSTRVSFDEALSNCRDKGGHLWVPALDDPLLWERIFKHFPEMFKAHKKDVFIGIGRQGSRFIGLNGVDYTKSPLILSGENMYRQCFTFNFDHGAFYIKGVPICGRDGKGTRGDFVCQYKRI